MTSSWKKGSSSKISFPSSNANKNSGSDSRLNPAPTWNHAIPRGTSFQAFLALFFVKTHSSSHSWCFTPSSSARETPQTSGRRRSSNMSWETAPLHPSLPQHAHTHACVSTCSSTCCRKTPSATSFWDTDTANQLSYRCPSAGNVILFSDSEPKDVVTLEIPLRQVLYSAVIFIQCFTNMPNTQYAGKPRYLNNWQRDKIGFAFEIPRLLVCLVQFSLSHRSEPGLSEKMGRGKKPDSTP